MKILFRLSAKDLWYDRKISACIIATILAVVAPLLLLFSLKFGIISQLQQQLISDPRNLEIKLFGNGLGLEQSWFDWLDEQPETGFSIGKTRSLNMQETLKHNLQAVEILLIPTKKNDPLLPEQGELKQNQIVLSQVVADNLKITVGQSVQLLVRRNQQNKLLQLEVSAVISETFAGRNTGFISLPLLVAIERYKDNQAEDFEPQTLPSQFANARIYAKDLESVAPLTEKLRQHPKLQGGDVSNKAAEIENMRAIDYVLSVIFWVILVTSAVGCLLSLAGAFFANVDRKRKDIAQLRLLGFSKKAVVFYFILQSLVLSTIAFVLSCLLFALGSSLFNQVLHGLSDDFVSGLESFHFGLAFVISVLMAMVIAGIATLPAVKIQPAESLREI